jgi:hypothetical protein
LLLWGVRLEPCSFLTTRRRFFKYFFMVPVNGISSFVVALPDPEEMPPPVAATVHEVHRRAWAKSSCRSR